MAHHRGKQRQIGDLPGVRSVSAAAEVEAAAKRLRDAAKSNDGSVLRAALESAGDVLDMISWDISLSEKGKEIWDLTSLIRSRLDTDPDLLRFAELRRSKSIEIKVKRLWDLMVAESRRLAAEETLSEQDVAEVTREGYRRFHARVAKALTQSERFSPDLVKVAADVDWAEDISRYSGTSHITIWLSVIREAFKKGAGEAVAEHGFKALFARYDVDKSGDLSFSEFTMAVRKDLGISESVVTDKELKKLFNAVDIDSGGTVDADEFLRWLFNKDGNSSKGKSHKTKGNIVQVKRKFKAASAAMCEEIGWNFIFQKYDEDGNGELEFCEFRKAVRRECDLSKETVPDKHLKEIFDIIDADQSGAIDAKELQQLLGADLGASTLTWSAFYSSILELTSVWSKTETSEQFVLFLQSLFDDITEGNTASCCALLEGGGDSSTLPVFIDESRTHANFKLKSVDDIQSCVIRCDDDKLRLNIEGFDSDHVDPWTNDSHLRRRSKLRGNVNRHGNLESKKKRMKDFGTVDLRGIRSKIDTGAFKRKARAKKRLPPVSEPTKLVQEDDVHSAADHLDRPHTRGCPPRRTAVPRSMTPSSDDGASLFPSRSITTPVRPSTSNTVDSDRAGALQRRRRERSELKSLGADVHRRARSSTGPQVVRDDSFDAGSSSLIASPVVPAAASGASTGAFTAPISAHWTARATGRTQAANVYKKVGTGVTKTASTSLHVPSRSQVESSSQRVNELAADHLLQDKVGWTNPRSNSLFGTGPASSSPVFQRVASPTAFSQIPTFFRQVSPSRSRQKRVTSKYMEYRRSPESRPLQVISDRVK